MVIGGAIGAIQYLPVREYVPFSPRAGGKGWEHAVSYSMPPEELVNTYLPQFTGMLDKYWGRNGIHFHSEYIGAVVLVLAGLGFGWAATRGGRKFIWFWLGTLVISVLWALGGYTPFYRIVYYAIVPGTKFFRAPSTMLYVVSFSVAVLAACGMDRVVRGAVRRGYLLGWLGAAAADRDTRRLGWPDEPRDDDRRTGARRLGRSRTRLIWRSARFDRSRSWRSRVGLIWAISTKRLQAAVGASILIGAAAIDLWTIERSYWMFSPPAAQLYASDSTIQYVRNQPQPGRVIPLPLGSDLARGDPFLRPGGQANGLMIDRVRNVLGYHGNQLGRYDDLLGLQEGGRQLANPNFWALTNARFWLTNTDSLPIPGVRRVVGPVRNAAGSMVYLFELPGDNSDGVACPGDREGTGRSGAQHRARPAVRRPACGAVRTRRRPSRRAP